MNYNISFNCYYYYIIFIIKKMHTFQFNKSYVFKRNAGKYVKEDPQQLSYAVSCLKIY